MLARQDTTYFGDRMLIQTHNTPNAPILRGPSQRPAAEGAPSTPKPAQDSVTLGSTPAPAAPGKPEVPESPEGPEHSLLYRSARFVIGSVGGVVGGAIGAAVGGVIHAGDTVIPLGVQKVASKILRPGLAAAGAVAGAFVGVSVIPLIGPAKGAAMGAIAGAVIGGGLPGALDALAASGKGAVCGGWKGRKQGYDLMANAFDKVAEKLQKPPAPPQDPPAPPPAS